MPSGQRSAAPKAAEEKLAATVQRLRDELETLRRSERSRAVIEQAKGLLAARLDCSPEEAFEHLSRMSQQTQMKVAEVAAGLVGIAAPMPAPADSTGGGSGFHPETYIRGGPRIAFDGDDGGPPLMSLPEEATARYHLTCSAMAGAEDCGRLAEALWEDGLQHLGVYAVLLGVLEPDGAVRLVGTHGLSRSLVSAWQRVPSSLNVAFLRAVADGRPLWISRKDATELGYQLFGEGEMRACVPLRSAGRIFGIASILWRDEVTPDSTTRAYVTALTDACARRLSQLLRSTDGAVPVASPAAHWVEAVMEALPGSYALLSPVRDGDGTIVDWRFDCCSPEARDASGRTAGQLTGGRLLALYPHVASTGLLEAYERTLRSGCPFASGPAEFVLASRPRLVTVTMSIRAARFGDGLLLHWCYHDDERQLASRLERFERLGDTGWAEWNFVTGDVAWGRSTYEILMRDPAKGPVKLGALHRYVAPEDAPALAEAVHTVTRRRKSIDLELSLHRHGRTRRIRLVADPVIDRLGRLAAVHSVVRQLTEP